MDGARHCIHSWHHSPIKEGIVLLTSLHQQGKLRQLLGSCVEVNAQDVVLQDVFYRSTTIIALLLIYQVEQIEAFVEYVA